MPQTRKPSLAIRRKLKASAEKVFDAWTRPEALKRWFGPSNDMEIVIATTDLRVGGRYRIVGEMPGGEQHRVGGVYRDIVPGRKLVFTWAWESTPEGDR